MASDVRLKLGADTSELKKGFNQLESNVKKTTNNIKNSFASLAGPIAALGASLLAGLSLSKVISEAKEFEESVNELRIALKLSGIESESAVDGFKDFASEVQRTTRFSDGAVLSASALIQGLGQLTGEGLEKATTAALDLSTALGIDLKAAALLVGKAAAGEVSSFSRYGLIIKKGADVSETFANALDGINSKFGGSSRESVNTYAGAVDQLENNFGDVVKNIGLGIIQNKKLLENLKNLSTAFANLVPQAIEFGVTLGQDIVKGIDSVSKLLKQLPEIIAAVTTALVLMNAQLLIATAVNVVSGVVKIVGAFKLLLPIVLAVSAPIAAVAAGIAAVSAGAFFLVKSFREAREENQKFNEELAKTTNLAGKQSGLQGIRDELKFLDGPKASTNASLLINTSVDLAPIRKSFETFASTTLKGTASELEKISIMRKEQLDKLNEFRDKGVVSQKRFESLRLRIVDSAKEKEIAIIKKGEDKKIKEQEDADKKELDRIKSRNSIIGSLAATIFQGPRGVVSAFSQVASTMVDAVLPGLGAAAGQLIGFLAQGPEAVKAQIQGFVDNIPVIIEAIVDSIPAVIDSLVENAPAIIQRLVELAPEIMIKMAKIMIIELPKAAIAFTIGLIKRVPSMVGSFIKALISQAGRFISALVDGIKGAFGFGGGTGSKVGRVALGVATGGLSEIARLGFAEGGVVPGGAPFTDRVPAALTPGESVLSRDTTNKLDRFLNSASGGQNVTINLQVGEAQLANVLLNLNKQGYRTA